MDIEGIKQGLILWHLPHVFMREMGEFPGDSGNATR